MCSFPLLNVEIHGKIKKLCRKYTKYLRHSNEFIVSFLILFYHDLTTIDDVHALLWSAEALTTQVEDNGPAGVGIVLDVVDA